MYVCSIIVGVVDLFYDLPEYSDLGNWTIQVQAGAQTENKTIRVEKYFKPFHEVRQYNELWLLKISEVLWDGYKLIKYIHTQLGCNIRASLHTSHR
jgi:hypothetical protein